MLKYTFQNCMSLLSNVTIVYIKRICINNLGNGRGSYFRRSTGYKTHTRSIVFGKYSSYKARNMELGKCSLHTVVPSTERTEVSLLPIEEHFHFTWNSTTLKQTH